MICHDGDWIFISLLLQVVLLVWLNSEFFICLRLIVSIHKQEMNEFWKPSADNLGNFQKYVCVKQNEKIFFSQNFLTHHKTRFRDDCVRSAICTLGGSFIVSNGKMTANGERSDEAPAQGTDSTSDIPIVMHKVTEIQFRVVGIILIIFPLLHFVSETLVFDK